MSRVVVDATLPEKLRGLQAPVELVDPAGQVLGTFLPHADTVALEPQVSEEEIRRRMAEDGGRPLADILADRGNRA